VRPTTLITLTGALIGLLGLGFRANVWLKGGPAGDLLPFRARLSEFFRRAIAHVELLPGGWRAPLMHSLIFWGFLGLLVSAAGDVGIRFGIEPPPSWNRASFLLRELAAIAFLWGVGMAIHRRFIRRWIRLPRDLPGDAIGLGLLLTTGVSGVLVAGARVALQPSSNESIQLTAHAAAWGLQALGWESARLFVPLQLVHVTLAACLYAAIPLTRLRHLVVAPLAILFTLRPQGTNQARLAGGLDLSWAQRLQLDACSGCGRCDVACPPAEEGADLSPMSFLLEQRTDQRAPGTAGGILAHCTQCGACEEACPIGISHLDRFEGLREHRILATAEAATTLRSDPHA